MCVYGVGRNLEGGGRNNKVDLQFPMLLLFANLPIATNRSEGEGGEKMR